jgi:hypothetical protein
MRPGNLSDAGLPTFEFKADGFYFPPLLLKKKHGITRTIPEVVLLVY